MLIFLAGCPQRPLPRAYIRNGEAPGAVLAKMLSLIDTKEIRPAQAALALNLVSEMDFLRLKAVARLYARGLPPDVDWDDLLQEAFTRVLVGARIKPSQKGSAAFAGLKFPAKARFSEYFGPDALARLKEPAETRRRELEDKKK